MEKASTRAILWDHFLDVVCLLILEGVLAALIEGMGRVLSSLQVFLRYSHRILVWCAIATVIQFAACSLALLTVRNVEKVRKAYGELRDVSR
jgi:hypothetical protein